MLEKLLLGQIERSLLPAREVIGEGLEKETKPLWLLEHICPKRRMHDPLHGMIRLKHVGQIFDQKLQRHSLAPLFEQKREKLIQNRMPKPVHES